MFVNLGVLKYMRLLISSIKISFRKRKERVFGDVFGNKNPHFKKSGYFKKLLLIHGY